MTEDFLMEKQTIYEMEYVFNLKDFIDFMMIQYNVNAKIESDEISEKETRKWMQDTLRFFFVPSVAVWGMERCFCFGIPRSYHIFK